jgi:hypothetical protein
MKIGIILTTGLLVLLAVSYPGSAAIPNMHMNKIADYSDTLESAYHPSSFTASKSYSPLIGSSRIDPVYGDVVEYKIKVKVGSGEYDNMTLTNAWILI